jgi:hypothetical protein
VAKKRRSDVDCSMPEGLGAVLMQRKSRHSCRLALRPQGLPGHRR